MFVFCAYSKIHNLVESRSHWNCKYSLICVTNMVEIMNLCGGKDKFQAGRSLQAMAWHQGCVRGIYIRL